MVQTGSEIWIRNLQYNSCIPIFSEEKSFQRKARGWWKSIVWVLKSSRTTFWSATCSLRKIGKQIWQYRNTQRNYPWLTGRIPSTGFLHGSLSRSFYSKESMLEAEAEQISFQVVEGRPRRCFSAAIFHLSLPIFWALYSRFQFLLTFQSEQRRIWNGLIPIALWSQFFYTDQTSLISSIHFSHQCLAPVIIKSWVTFFCGRQYLISSGRRTPSSLLFWSHFPSVSANFLRFCKADLSPCSLLSWKHNNFWVMHDAISWTEKSICQCAQTQTRFRFHFCVSIARSELPGVAKCKTSTENETDYCKGPKNRRLAPLERPHKTILVEDWEFFKVWFFTVRYCPECFWSNQMNNWDRSGSEKVTFAVNVKWVEL